jgi:FKBP-type peptidyl-prolyl cis-trans isomerase FklB
MGYGLNLLLLAMLVSGPGDAPEPNDPGERAGYSLGHQIGRDLALQGVGVDTDALRRGLLDGLAGADPAMDAHEMQALLSEVKRRLVDLERGREHDDRKRHRARAEEFLAGNAARDGVVLRKSGLQYEVLRKGKGKKPRANDKVVVHYRGSTIDGKEFHDSRRRPGVAETLHVSGVVRGMSEALRSMRTGAHWRLYLSPDLAYGRRGPLADQAVIFEIELISIERSP